MKQETLRRRAPRLALSILLAGLASAGLAVRPPHSVLEQMPPVNLPELMKTSDGTEVKSVADWEQKRRPEILDFFTQNMHGIRPVERPEGLAFTPLEPDREMLGGEVIRKRAKISFKGPRGDWSFNVMAFLPKTDRPVPVFVFICNRALEKYVDPELKNVSFFCPVDLITSRGYAVAVFKNTELALDEYPPDLTDGKLTVQDPVFTNGLYACFAPERTYRSWSAISAWAWGASRVMDWIETQPAFDAKHVAVIGHSRGGKTSLWAGATDPRFGLVCVNDSGCCGAKLNHVPVCLSETIALDNLVNPHWFCRAYREFNGRDAVLPFDQHWLAALTAPRLLYIASATADYGAGPWGEFLTARHASPAWELYGKKGLVEEGPFRPETPFHKGCVGHHLRSGGHSLNRYDWGCYMDFADRHGWRDAPTVTVQTAEVDGVPLRWFEEMVPMKDGVKLYTYGALPPAGETRGIILSRSPYTKETRENMRAYAKSQQQTLARGYAYVVQHVRGTGMSEGDWVPYVNEREDGLATLDWIRRLPHYGGEIFLSGGSYLSSVHWSYLDTNPPDVKGAVLNVQDVNRYNIHYRNGQYKIALHGSWVVKGYKTKNKTLKRDPSVKFTDLPLKGFSVRRLGEYVADLEDTWQHPRPEDAWWRTPGTAGGEYRRALLDSTMPVMMVTGFYDIYTEGIFDMWRELPPARRANCALVVDAFDHGGRRPKDVAADSPVFFPNGSRHDEGAVDSQLDWFDGCRGKGPLKHVRPGETRWYALWENAWHSAPEMTNAAGSLTLAFQPDRGLSETPAAPSAAPVRFDYDPSAPPSFPGAGCLGFGGMQKQPAPGFRADVVSFVSRPFARRYSVRGRMKATLAVTSDCDDTAFYIRVSLRKRDGEWYTLRDDIKAISWDHAGYTPGAAVKIDYTLSDHAFVLEEGDALRVDVAGANAAAFVPHTNYRGPFAEQTKSRVAHNAILPGGSSLTLPVE